MTKTWVTLSLMAALAVGILAATPATGEAQTLTPGDHAMTMEFGGLTRQYIVHVPPAGSGDTALPVLMVFHGGGQNDAKMQAYALIDTTADAEGFVTVYVSGTESGHGNRIEFWNSGFCCGYPYDNNVDDVGFSAAIIESLKTQINMDADRVYATGISNGGMMTYRNICERADLYAAAVIVEGAMDLTTTCSPSRSLPLMIVHATNDQNIPYDGGVGPNSKSHIDNTSVDSTVDAWKTINNCTGDGTTTTQSGLSTDVTQVERWVWDSCDTGVEMALYKIDGGAHRWPLQASTSWGSFMGETDSGTTVSPNALIWNFLKDHSLADGVSKGKSAK